MQRLILDVEVIFDLGNTKQAIKFKIAKDALDEFILAHPEAQFSNNDTTFCTAIAYALKNIGVTSTADGVIERIYSSKFNNKPTWVFALSNANSKNPSLRFINTSSLSAIREFTAYAKNPDPAVNETHALTEIHELLDRKLNVHCTINPIEASNIAHTQFLKHIYYCKAPDNFEIEDDFLIPSNLAILHAGHVVRDESENSPILEIKSSEAFTDFIQKQFEANNAFRDNISQDEGINSDPLQKLHTLTVNTLQKAAVKYLSNVYVERNFITYAEDKDSTIANNIAKIDKNLAELNQKLHGILVVTRTTNVKQKILYLRVTLDSSLSDKNLSELYIIAEQIQTACNNDLGALNNTSKLTPLQQRVTRNRKSTLMLVQNLLHKLSDYFCNKAKQAKVEIANDAQGSVLRNCITERIALLNDEIAKLQITQKSVEELTQLFLKSHPSAKNSKSFIQHCGSYSIHVIHAEEHLLELRTRLQNLKVDCSISQMSYELAKTTAILKVYQAQETHNLSNLHIYLKKAKEEFPASLVEEMHLTYHTPPSLLQPLQETKVVDEPSPKPAEIKSPALQQTDIVKPQMTESVPVYVVHAEPKKFSEPKVREISNAQLNIQNIIKACLNVYFWEEQVTFATFGKGEKVYLDPNHTFETGKPFIVVPKIIRDLLDLFLSKENPATQQYIAELQTSDKPTFNISHEESLKLLEKISNCVSIATTRQKQRNFFTKIGRKEATKNFIDDIARASRFKIHVAHEKRMDATHVAKLENFINPIMIQSNRIDLTREMPSTQAKLTK